MIMASSINTHILFIKTHKITCHVARCVCGTWGTPAGRCLPSSPEGHKLAVPWQPCHQPHEQNSHQSSHSLPLWPQALRQWQISCSTAAQYNHSKGKKLKQTLNVSDDVISSWNKSAAVLCAPITCSGVINRARCASFSSYSVMAVILVCTG